MTTAIAREHDAAARLPLDTRSAAGTIIVASDGEAPAATALLVAKRLAERTGARLRVVSVVEPTASIVPAPMLLAEPMPESRIRHRRDLVQEQIDRLVGATHPVELQVEVGWTPEVLTRIVQEEDTRFFVAGLVHHGRIDRMARAETPLSVLRGADAPVLAVPWGAIHEPRCVVIGVDLADASVRAARLAEPLLDGAKTVYLVHVHEPLPPLADIPLATPMDEAAVTDAFDRIRHVLTLPDGAAIKSRILVGNPAFELADFAEYVKADLLVLGHEHRGVWGRFLHGSVAERAYRIAGCGVLIVPNEPVG